MNTFYIVFSWANPVFKCVWIATCSFLTAADLTTSFLLVVGLTCFGSCSPPVQHQDARSSMTFCVKRSTYVAWSQRAAAAGKESSLTASSSLDLNSISMKQQRNSKHEADFERGLESRHSRLDLRLPFVLMVQKST